MEPIEYVRALIRRWPIIAVTAFIGALFAYLGTDAKPAPITREYLATNTMTVGGADEYGQFNQNPAGGISFAQVPLFATRGEVPRRVAEQLQYDGNPATLASEVVVTADNATGTVTFESTQDNPQDAVAIADAFAETTRTYIAEKQQQDQQTREATASRVVNDLEEELADLDQTLTDEIIEQRDELAGTGQILEGDATTRAQRDAVASEYSSALQTYRALVNSANAGLTLVPLEQAQPVEIQTGGFTPPRTRATRVPLGAALGALLGIGIALLAERLDGRLRDRRRAEQAFGGNVIGEVPTLTRAERAAHVIVGPDLHFPSAESLRSLKTSLTFVATGGYAENGDDRVGVIVVTSAGPAEGKSTVAANLASAFAETGRTVLVVNADFRRPVIATWLAPEDRPRLPGGITSIGRVDPTEFVIASSVPGIDLLDLAPIEATPGDLTRATLRILRSVADRYDAVLVDTPPLIVTTEALEFAHVASAMLLVGRLGRTSAANAERAGELARFAGVKQLVIALTDTGNQGIGRESYGGYYAPKPERRLRLGRAGKASVAAPDPAAPTTSASDEWAAIDTIVARPDDSISTDR